jgi:hypothetical protein
LLGAEDRAEQLHAPVAAIMTLHTGLESGDPCKAYADGVAPTRWLQRDPASIEPAGEPRNGGLDLVKVVEDVTHVLGLGPCIERRVGIVCLAKAQHSRVQMRGLDHGEACAAQKSTSGP